MGAPIIADILHGSSFQLVCDNPKGHQSDFAPSIRKRSSSAIRSSPVAGPKKKLQLCRWDAAPALKGNNAMPVKPIKKPSSSHDSPPSLKRLMSPPPASLKNVLKPVRRLSFEKKLDEICGVDPDTKNMTTADLLSSVLNNLDLLDDDDETNDAMMFDGTSIPNF